MVGRCVRSINLANEEALAHWELSPQKQTNNLKSYKLPQNGGNYLVST